MAQGQVSAAFSSGKAEKPDTARRGQVSATFTWKSLTLPSVSDLCKSVI